MTAAQQQRQEAAQRALAGVLTESTRLKYPGASATTIIRGLELQGYEIVDRDWLSEPIAVPGTGVVVDGWQEISPGVWVERDAAGNIATVRAFGE